MAQKILVDTTPGFMQPTIYYSQGDVGTTFQIDLQSRFGDALPASPTVTIQATKPSGLGFSVAADSISSNIATFTLTETMSNEAGRFPAEVEISKNDVTLYTANFYIQVEASPHPEGTTDGDAETLIPTLTLLVERVETAASNILDMTVVAETLPAGSDATYSYDEETNTATFGIPRGADGSVTSVAGKTGAVTLDADDVAYDSTDTYASGTVGAELTDLNDAKADSIVESASGSVASFSDGANGLPMKSVVCGIEPVQSGSGNPSPTNVRPITGWTGMNVYRTGKTLFNADDRESETVNGITSSVSNNIITASGTSTASGDISVDINEVLLKQGVTYTFSVIGLTKSGDNILVYFHEKNGVYVMSEYVKTDASYITTSITPSKDYVIDNFIIRINPGVTISGSGGIQLELGSTATDYEAYNGNTYSVDWTSEAGTVYGGELNLTTGVLTVTHANIASYVGETINEPWISSMDVYSSGTTPTTGAQVVYTLATPTTVQLTPTQINSLLGANNLWCDTNGDSEVEYRADTKLYIDGLTEPDDDMVADANITSGSYFIVNNKLYLATAAIAQGADIIVGTNCTATNIAEALNALNA